MGSGTGSGDGQGGQTVGWAEGMGSGDGQQRWAARASCRPHGRAGHPVVLGTCQSLRIHHFATAVGPPVFSRGPCRERVLSSVYSCGCWWREGENLQLLSPDVMEQTLTAAEFLAKNGVFFPRLRLCCVLGGRTDSGRQISGWLLWPRGSGRNPGGTLLSRPGQPEPAAGLSPRCQRRWDVAEGWAGRAETPTAGWSRAGGPAYGLRTAAGSAPDGTAVSGTLLLLADGLAGVQRTKQSQEKHGSKKSAQDGKNVLKSCSMEKLN